MNARTTATSYRTATSFLRVAASLGSLLFTAHAGAEVRDPRGVTWSIEWENDAVFHSDNQFTNGIFVQKNGPAVHDWDLVKGTPAFGKSLGAWFLPKQRDDLWFRESWSIGQNMQTPEDTEETEPILNDVPYAGLLAVQNSWIGYDDRDLFGFGWLLGIVGPASLAEPTQKGFHALINGDDPNGWSNQIDTEPVLNLYWERKHKLARARWADLALAGGANLGNLFTGAKVTLESRFGWHLPTGFVHLPDPLGYGLSYAATQPQQGKPHAIYGSLALRSSFAAYSVLLDGNTFGDSQSIDYNRVAHAVIAGAHYERQRWGMHLNWLWSTDSLDKDAVPPDEDTSLNYGTFTLDLRF